MASHLAPARAFPLLESYKGLHPAARGCALMMLATFMFAGMHTAIRYSTQQLPPVEVAFFRNVFGLVVIAPLLVRHGPSLFSTKRPGLHVVVTGRNAKPELIAAADLVTEMALVKHHFAAGVKAQPGIEF